MSFREGLRRHCNCLLFLLRHIMAAVLTGSMQEKVHVNSIFGIVAHMVLR